MKFLNGWKNRRMQWDKFEFRFRLGAIDVIRIKYDHSDRYFEVRIINLGFNLGGRRK